MDIVRRFARNLRVTREARGLSQGELAKKAGVSVSYVSMLERGKRVPPITTVAQIGRTLRVPPSRLIEG